MTLLDRILCEAKTYEYGLEGTSSRSGMPEYVSKRPSKYFKNGVVAFNKRLPLDGEDFGLVPLDPRRFTNKMRLYDRLERHIKSELKSKKIFVVKNGRYTTALHYSTRPGIKYQLSHFTNKAPTGHGDRNEGDWRDMVQELWVMMPKKEQAKWARRLLPYTQEFRG